MKKKKTYNWTAASNYTKNNVQNFTFPFIGGRTNNILFSLSFAILTQFFVATKGLLNG